MNELSLQEQIMIGMKRKELTYQKMIPLINEMFPENIKPVHGRSELSRAVKRGYNTGKKNNAIIDAVRSIVEV